MTDPTRKPTSVQGAMKQTAKTEAERGEPVAAPATGEKPQAEHPGREGDKPIDRSTTGGSSPAEKPPCADAAADHSNIQEMP